MDDPNKPAAPSHFAPPDAATRFTPRNPQFRERVARSFQDQRIMDLIGARLGTVDPGVVEVRLPFREELTQQHGRLHGGVIGMLLDNACSGAAFTLFPAGTAVLCVEYKVNFMTSSSGTELVTRGRVVRPGRTLTVCVGEAHVVNSAGDAKLVAVSQSTLMSLSVEDGIPEG